MVKDNTYANSKKPAEFLNFLSCPTCTNYGDMKIKILSWQDKSIETWVRLQHGCAGCPQLYTGKI